MLLPKVYAEITGNSVCFNLIFLVTLLEQLNQPYFVNFALFLFIKKSRKNKRLFFLFSEKPIFCLTGHKGWFVYSEKVYQDKLKIFNCN